MSANVMPIRPASLAGNAALSTVQLPPRGPLSPHQQLMVDGVLATGNISGRLPTAVARLCLEPLTDLVRHTVTWPGSAADGATWAGTFRFLIVEFQVAAGPLYVQIWSEPNDSILMEVGPGERDDPALQAIGERMKPALSGRGFAIGGNGRNYRKRLVAPRENELSTIACELLALVSDVLEYDGTSDLRYKFCQGTHFRLDHVCGSLSREALQRILLEWDIRSTPAKDDDNELAASACGFDFRLLMFEPRPDNRGEFDEVHFMCIVPMDEEKARELVNRVNSTRFLFKSSLIPATESQQSAICFTLPLALTGGVTLASLRYRVMDWFRSMRTICGR